jgi:hypothetical protein
MQPAQPLSTAQDPPPLPAEHHKVATSTPQGDLWDFAEACMEQSAAALHEARAASPAELSHAIAAAREAHAMDKPADLLEVLARIKGHSEEHLGRAMVDLSNKVAATLAIYQPIIPFGGKLIAPSAFYDAFDQIHKIARILLSPVIYAEDTDAIGTASINPVASAILAEEIRSSVFKRFGIRPFVTASRLDYESWTFLSRKHFEL